MYCVDVAYVFVILLFFVAAQNVIYENTDYVYTAYDRKSSFDAAIEKCQAKQNGRIALIKTKKLYDEIIPRLFKLHDRKY